MNLGLSKTNNKKENFQAEFDELYNGNVKVEFSTDKYGNLFEVSGILVKKHDGRKDFFSFEPEHFQNVEYETIWDENWEDIEESIIDKYYLWKSGKKS